MDWKLPTTKYTPATLNPRRKRMSDPRDVVGIIKRRTSHIHPIFHHVKAATRIAVGVAFIMISSYAVLSPYQATRTFKEAVAYVNQSTPVKDFTATVLQAFDSKN